MKVRKRIRVYGIVQGVGFRPFIFRIAKKSGVAGSVCNKGPYVEIYTEGTEAQTEDFLRRLKSEAPERSSILKTDVQERPSEGDEDFLILQSSKVKGDVFVSPDIAICPKCKKELYDPNDRRYLHPFINCTACGPRLTILDSMPYDRVRTSMGEFPMCPSCAHEYTHASTRRYHAQPVCCHDCGPHLYLIGREERDASAILAVRKVIRDGGIAAVKGIGGFHLCCDATNREAVIRLRKLKDRPMKPFAVMLKNMETAERECLLEKGQREILDGPQKPILLLKKREHPETRLTDLCAPDNASIGVMLPYAPVQLLLFDYPLDQEGISDCFVMTSGNPRGAPICMTDEEAEKELSRMSDIILSNDRKIRIRADDSVMSWYDGKPYMIRRSRGYAPLPFLSGESVPHRVLAVGGELKNTFCLASNDLYYPSPYIGDMADLRSVKALQEAVVRMERLLEIDPEAAAVDLHPRYNTSAFGRELAEAQGWKVIEVQHHWAHIVSCMAENDRFDEVIGVSFDGTGYGTDGTIWGGEFLRCTRKEFRRIGALDPFPQAGGDLSSKEGWRIAVSLLLRISENEEDAERKAVSLGVCEAGEFRLVKAMIRGGVNCVTSTSAGRIFDAASAILGIRRKSTFEGEASMALEYHAVRWEEAHAEELRMTETDTKAGDSGEENRKEVPLPGKDDFFRMDVSSIFRNLITRREEGWEAGRSAYYFHKEMADLILRGCLLCRKMTGLDTVALSGGVMQNLLLLRLSDQGLKNEGFTVLKHSLSPPNDGGISYGQAVIAMEKMKGEEICV